LKGKGLNYYLGHDAYSAFKNVTQDMQVDIAGTGVCAFKTSYFNPINLIHSEYKKMSDVIFSLEAKKQNKKIQIITHGQEWIKEQRTKINIHTEQIKNSQTQTKLCDEILKLK